MIYDADNGTQSTATPTSPYSLEYLYQRVLSDGTVVVYWSPSIPPYTTATFQPPKEVIGRGWSAAKLRRAYEALSPWATDRQREEHMDRQRAKYVNKLNGLGKLTKALYAQGYTSRVAERRTSRRFSPGPRRPCYRSR